MQLQHFPHYLLQHYHYHRHQPCHLMGNLVAFLLFRTALLIVFKEKMMRPSMYLLW